MKNKFFTLPLLILLCFSLFCGCSQTPIEETEEYIAGYQTGQADAYQPAYDEGYNAAMAEIESQSAENLGTYFVDTKEDPLTIREEAKQNASKLGTIPRGENIEITDIQSHWGYVTYDGISGWINLDYCTKGKNPNPSSVEVSETVYVTKTGECYHKEGCSYLKSKIPMILEQAQKNYRPCSRCY